MSDDLIHSKVSIFHNPRNAGAGCRNMISHKKTGADERGISAPASKWIDWPIYYLWRKL